MKDKEIIKFKDIRKDLCEIEKRLQTLIHSIEEVRPGSSRAAACASASRKNFGYGSEK